jgi:hypothetical protein
VVLPIPEPAPVPVAEPPVASTVVAVDPSADVPANPIAPPAAPVFLSADPVPAPAALSVAPPDPNGVPGPIGAVGLMIAAGVFGVRKLVRRKPAEESTADETPAAE